VKKVGLGYSGDKRFEALKKWHKENTGSTFNHENTLGVVHEKKAWEPTQEALELETKSSAIRSHLSKNKKKNGVSERYPERNRKTRADDEKVPDETSLSGVKLGALPKSHK